MQFSKINRWEFSHNSSEFMHRNLLRFHWILFTISSKMKYKLNKYHQFVSVINYKSKKHSCLRFAFFRAFVWFLNSKISNSIHSCYFITDRNEDVAKVMFLLVCVILCKGGLPQCMLGYHPLGRKHPPERSTPPAGSTPAGRKHPPIRHTVN